MGLKIPKVMIAAVKSGSGKTTITCAFLKQLLCRKKHPVSFKCGPDYIDPMFHPVQSPHAILLLLLK